MKNLENLAEFEARKYQERLSHYLKSYRTKFGFTHSKMAKILGYSSDNHYKTFEAPSINNRAVKALDFLAGFGKLSDMNLWDFLTYLKNPPVSQRSHLFPWEKSTIEAFSKLDIIIRRNFTNKICEAALKDDNSKNRLERLLRMVIYCFSMSDKDFSALEQIVYRLARHNIKGKEIPPPKP